MYKTSFPRLVRASWSARHMATRPFSIAAARQQQQQQQQQPASIPYTDTCPAPSCPCAAAPPGLDIDHSSRLIFTMTAYAEHVVVCTGVSDWASRIEEADGATGEFVRGVKGVVGKGGTGFDVGSSPPLYTLCLVKDRVWLT